MKDFEERTDGPQGAPPGVVKHKGHAQTEGRDASHVAPHHDAAALSAPELSHPANAAPLADMLTHLQQTHGNTYVQRVVGDMNDMRSSSQTHSSGQSLDTSVKTQMESAFGENFDDVRVHTDSGAEKIAEELDARAVTRGRDIYFGKSEYDPVTHEGKEVLAHELAHVAQQANHVETTTKSSREASEAEAHELAHRVACGGHAQVKETADATSEYRIPRAPDIPLPLQQRPPAPTGAQPAQTQGTQPGQSVTVTFDITPALSAAISRYFNERAFEAEQIELYIAPEYDRWRLIINTLIQRFPAAWRDVIGQRPAGVDQETFLRSVGNLIWEQVRAPFLQLMDQRYRSDPAFKRRVDRARRVHETPVVVPPDARIV